MRDAHRIRDRMELSFEPHTVVWAALLVLGSLGGAFAGGYRVGAASGDGAGDEDEAAPLDSLDNLSKPRRGSAEDDELTFHGVLSPDDEAATAEPAKKKDRAKKPSTAAATARGGSSGSASASAGAGAPVAGGTATARDGETRSAVVTALAIGSADVDTGEGAETVELTATEAAKRDRDLLASLVSVGSYSRGPEYDDDTPPAPVTSSPIVRTVHHPVLRAPEPVVHTAAPVVVAPAPAVRAAAPVVPAPASPHAPAADTRWTVQVGSYPTSDDAATVVASLKKRGYAPHVIEADVPGRGRWYRVRVGDFAVRASAISLKDEIDAFHAEPCLVTNR